MQAMLPNEKEGKSAVKPSPSRPLTRKRSDSRVSFSDANNVVVVEPPLPDNKNCSWYSSQEIQMFRKTSDMTPDLVDHRRDFVRSLLEIQREHKEYGIQDPVGLRQVSRSASRQSLKRALARAQMILEGDGGP